MPPTARSRYPGLLPLRIEQSKQVPASLKTPNPAYSIARDIEGPCATTARLASTLQAHQSWRSPITGHDIKRLTGPSGGGRPCSRTGEFGVALQKISSRPGKGFCRPSPPVVKIGVQGSSTRASTRVKKLFSHKRHATKNLIAMNCHVSRLQHGSASSDCLAPVNTNAGDAVPSFVSPRQSNSIEQNPRSRCPILTAARTSPILPQAETMIRRIYPTIWLFDSKKGKKGRPMDALTRRTSCFPS